MRKLKENKNYVAICLMFLGFAYCFMPSLGKIGFYNPFKDAWDITISLVGVMVMLTGIIIFFIPEEY